MPRTIHHPALQPLKGKFGDVKFLVGEFRDMVTVIVPREQIVAVCTFLRDEAALRYDMLAELNGIDYLNYPGAKHRFGVNYGLNRVRFVSPVPSGSRIRALITLQSVDAVSGGFQVTWQITIERDGSDKPACVAEWLVRYYPA